MEASVGYFGHRFEPGAIALDQAEGNGWRDRVRQITRACSEPHYLKVAQLCCGQEDRYCVGITHYGRPNRVCSRYDGRDGIASTRGRMIDCAHV